MARPRIDDEQIEKIKLYYSKKHQNFKNDSHMLRHLIDNFLAQNIIELASKTTIFNDAIYEMVESLSKNISTTVKKESIDPLREVNISLGMIIHLLIDEVYSGLTDGEKKLQLTKLKNEAVKAMAVDGEITSLTDLFYSNL